MDCGENSVLWVEAGPGLYILPYTDSLLHPVVVAHIYFHAYIHLGFKHIPQLSMVSVYDSTLVVFVVKCY